MNKNDLRKLIKEVFDEIKTEEKPLNELSLTTLTLNQFLDKGLTEADMLGATTRGVPDKEMQDYLTRVKDKEKLTTLKSLINEMINEIDWSRFNDVQTQCISPEEMVKRLNDILARSKLPSTERDKRDVNFPIVHGKSLKSDDAGNVDVQDFINKLIRPPTRIFTINEKAKHSETEKTLTVNTGIPAFKALLWDSDEKLFKVINTCPGAGKCVVGCFAMQGNYIRLDNVVMEYARRLQFLIDNPDNYEKRAYAELLSYAANAEGMNKTLVIRWNDSGDFFSMEYFRIAKQVTDDVIARGFKVDSSIYTKVGHIVKLATAAGFVASFSTDSKRSEMKKIDPNTTKLAVRVPRILWKGIFIKSGPRSFEKDEKGKLKFTDQQNGREELKKIIFKAFKGTDEGVGMTYDSLVFTDELPKSESPEQFKYNVIVFPSGDTDWGAQRRDVKNSYLLQH